MEGSDRRDRKSRDKGPASSDRDTDSRKRRREASPQGRAQKSFRPSHRDNREDRRRDAPEQNAVKREADHGRGSQRETPTGPRGRVNGKALAAQNGPPGRQEATKPPAETGKPSMPFIKNDKPYKYDLNEDDGIVLASDTGDMPDDATLRRVMGFAKFRTSHELKIPDNQHNWEIDKPKPSKYRQYMNRRDGFNRPLSPSRDG